MKRRKVAYRGGRRVFYDLGLLILGRESVVVLYDRSVVLFHRAVRYLQTLEELDLMVERKRHGRGTEGRNTEEKNSLQETRTCCKKEAITVSALVTPLIKDCFLASSMPC